MTHNACPILAGSLSLTHLPSLTYQDLLFVCLVVVVFFLAVILPGIVKSLPCHDFFFKGASLLLLLSSLPSPFFFSVVVS